MLWKTTAFAAATLILILISYKSMRSPRSHGFFRFFAWEVMLLLFLLNVNQWFEQPFAWNQIFSWILLAISLIPVIWGIILLRKSGHPEIRRDNSPDLLAFEKTSRLVTTGIYRVIRHPLYSSLLLVTWGIFFKAPSWMGGCLALTASVLLFLTSRADEKECILFFGSPYVEYMKKTRRFIPFVF